MKIVIVGTSEVGGGHERVLAFQRYLLQKGHRVVVFTFPNEPFEKVWRIYQLALGRATRNIRRIMEKWGERIEERIRKEKADAVIGVETKFSYVLTKNLNSLKIFSLEAPESIERSYMNRYTQDEIESLKELEIEIMKSSDYVIFPWETTERFTRENLWDGSNFVTIRYGCYPSEGKPSYAHPPSIISLGSLKFYWSNKELLSYLTKISPYNIDVYGKFKPEMKYNLNYRGYANSLKILYQYQFGLNTVSQDPFRQNHFSSRIINYLAYGLPVLFPQWQKYPNDLRGCIPYSKDNFVEVVNKYSERVMWERLVEKAKRQGHELDWNHTLKPLDKILGI
jgi:hypothetical protein